MALKLNMSKTYNGMGGQGYLALLEKNYVKNWLPLFHTKWVSLVMECIAMFLIISF